jgi:hypothetical protein
MGQKRTKKDVEDAYHRGFRDGYLAAPSTMSIILSQITKRKARKAYLKQIKALDR